MNVQEQWKSFLNKHAIFSLLGEHATGRLVQQLEMVSFAIGEIILREGEPGDCAYLIYSGKVRVFKQGRDGKPLLLGTLSAGDLFGEYALLHHQARSASVLAADDVLLLRIGQADFDQLLHAHPELATYLDRLMRQRAASNFLRLATFLGALPARQVVALLDQLQECRFPRGEIIVREGEVGDHLYILKSGEAKVLRGETQVLAYLGEGDYFGERALLLGEPRFASVVTLTDVDAFRLSREAFESLLPTAPQLQEQLRRRLEHYHRGTELASKLEVQVPLRGQAEPTADLVWETLANQPEPARPTGPRRGLRSWFAFWKRFPFIPQEDETDCGAAALAMIGRYHGRRLSVARLQDLAHVGATGASMLSLAHAAGAVGFQWRAVTTDFAHLAGLALPAVAHWKGYHYLVLYEVRADKVVVGDPAVGLVTVRRQDFEAGWTGKLLVLAPTERLRSHPQARASIGSLLAWLASERAGLGWLVLVSGLMAVLALALPVVAQQLVDGVLPSREASRVFPLLAGLLGVGIVLTAAGLLRQELLERLARHFSLGLGTGWFARLMELPLAYSQSRPMGAFLVRLEGTQESQQLVRLGLTTMLDLFLGAAALAMMFYYQAALGLVALLGFVVLSAAILFSFRFEQRRQQQAWLQKTAVRSILVESIQAQTTFKRSAAEPEACRKFAEARAAGPNPGSALMALAWGGVLLASAVTLWHGSVLVLAGEMTVGQLMACQILVVLAALPILAWTWRWRKVCALVYLLQKLGEVKETPAEQEQPAEPLPPLRGLLQFEDVSFRYHPESANVLSRINLAIQPGQVVALIGRSGAGKSTLAMLLERFYRPTEGTIRIDGFDLAAVDVRSLRAQVSVVSNDPPLFTGTIGEHIALADTGAGFQRVIEAAKLAGAHDFIMSLQRGYDTVIGPVGMRLSSGQNLGLCLARAFLKEPRILILDDVLPLLDAEAEPGLVKQLRTGARGRTTILISRRPLPASYADFIVVLDAGQIVETGTHRELLAQKGLYYYWTGMQ
jgi:ATP-binding cassette subfamily B protein